jgi:hypothetical protein
MFTDTKKQFINILTQDKQVKLDIKTFENNKLAKSESSTFLKTDDLFSKDAFQKLNIFQNKIPQTFITTLCTLNNQVVKPLGDLYGGIETAIPLDEKFVVSVPREDLEKEKGYFYSQIDYIVSPFTILYKIIESKSFKNSVNCFIFDNKIYLLILNNECKIAYGNLHEITSFDKVKDSNFYTDEVIGQKLYDEVYYLEVQEILNDTIEKFYQNNDGSEFIENINIYYSIKQLLDEQLDLLEESLVAKVNYYGISVSDYLFSLIFENKINAHSLIKPRSKKKDYKILLWGSLALVSFAAAGYLLYSQYSTMEDAALKNTLQKEIKDVPNVSDQKRIGSSVQEVKLPEHGFLNTKLTQELLVVFDAVPYDALLQEIEFKRKTTTIVASFLKDSPNINTFHQNMSAYYGDSKIILEDHNEVTSNIIFSNRIQSRLEQSSEGEKAKIYTKKPLLSTTQALQYITSIVGENSSVKFLKKYNEAYISYRFEIKMLLQEPKEFFTIIENINKQSYSILVDKPILFSKKGDAIETAFSVVFNQNKQSLEQLR